MGSSKKLGSTLTRAEREQPWRSKTRPLPVGLQSDFLFLSWQSSQNDPAAMMMKERYLKLVGNRAAAVPFANRRLRALCDFVVAGTAQVNANGTIGRVQDQTSEWENSEVFTRSEVYEKLRTSNAVELLPFNMHASMLFEHYYSTYAFVVSPAGRGLDCHRCKRPSDKHAYLWAFFLAEQWWQDVGSLTHGRNSHSAEGRVEFVRRAACCASRGLERCHNRKPGTLGEEIRPNGSGQELPTNPVEPPLDSIVATINPIRCCIPLLHSQSGHLALMNPLRFSLLISFSDWCVRPVFEFCTNPAFSDALRSK